MRVPLSWLREYVDIAISAEELAERLTLAGLEVAALHYVGVPQGAPPAGINFPKSDHLVWTRDKIVLGAIHEVKPHPNADKLVLAMVDFGAPAIEQVVTGAPNLFPYLNKGPLDPPLYTALALEGAEVFDGHAAVPTRMILKEKLLRGIPNRSMVCSAEELGLTGIEDGIILIPDPGFKPGTPFVDVWGDVIFEIELTPNMARAYSILGVAREVAALVGGTLREPSYAVTEGGAPIANQVSVQIVDSVLNPRFSAMLIRDITIQPSPVWMQRRLLAVGEHPINNIVDITNYVMFEVGQPLHAFDYDVLVARAHGQPGGTVPVLTTRHARPGENLVTLDGEERTLEDFNELVCDSAGILSLAGIKGGEDSKIQPNTRNVLLEAANWNYINIRKSMFTLKLNTEAGLRFSRGVHPAQTIRGVRRAAQLMHDFGNGVIAQGTIDQYPNPLPPVRVDLPLTQVTRLLGIPLTIDESAAMLRRLQFSVQVEGEVMHVEVPDHRTDLSGDSGIADLTEEIGRIYGYDRMPNTLIDDATPALANNPGLTREEQARDRLQTIGLRETINYRLTTPDAEARLDTTDLPSIRPSIPYVMIANPISLERTAMRQTLLNSVLTVIAANQYQAVDQQLFEIGPVFWPQDGQHLPREPRRLAIALTGSRTQIDWQTKSDPAPVDFYDLKGIIEALVAGLHLPIASFRHAKRGAFHPGRCAEILTSGQSIGFFGEVHPVVRGRYAIAQPVFAAEIDLDALLSAMVEDFTVTPIPTQPAVYQDIALIVDKAMSAAEVYEVIHQAGEPLLRSARLFDVYTGEPIPVGQKSLAYALTYQADDRTLTDKEVAKVHQQIVRAAEQKLHAKLRG